MKIRKIDDDIRGEFGIEEDVEGVEIIYVEKGKDEGEKRIEKGDVIVDIGKVKVKKKEDVKKSIDEMRREGRKNEILMMD